MTQETLGTHDVSLQFTRSFVGRRTVVLGYLLSNRAGFRERIGHTLGHLGLSMVRHAILPKHSAASERLCFSLLRGMSQDRITVLATEFAQRFLVPTLPEATRERWRRLRSAGWRIRLISNHIEEIVTAVCRQWALEVDELVCNRLQYRDHIATGRLTSPRVNEQRRTPRTSEEFTIQELEDLS